MSNSSPIKEIKNAGGTKRPAPSLGAPFEPDFDSSPPKPKKRQSRRPSSPHARLRYPSPLPTSSLGLTSSPPHRASPFIARRPPLQRTHSTLSERAPLGALPEIPVPDSGEPILLGRSSHSSHYQLSFNRHVSRTHIKIIYEAGTPKPTLLIECLGANGAKIHCDGHVFELRQGDTFTSQTADADIILDIMDSRVLVKWPRSARETSSATTLPLPCMWEDQEERAPRSPRVFVGKDLTSDFSPPPSPCPRPKANAPILPKQSLLSESMVTVYEDEPEEVEDEPDLPELPHPKKVKKEGSSGKRQSEEGAGGDEQSESELSELDLESDDEENAAISKFAFSFGPGPGSDLPPMATFLTRNGSNASLGSGKSEPKKRKRGSRASLKSTSPPPVHSRDHSLSPSKSKSLVKHLSNQLAFSRISSTPLSDIMSNLPPSILNEETVTREVIVRILNSVPWIGEIARSGKDAAGKPLESEYYYISEKDTDEERRNAVVEGLRKPGIRSCRKTHKQYFWRKPKLH
ncbi:hypothetical protein BDZ91DRAFT_506781 [Kalaharituber pfeilii]|nr:hypothetical protein BDZ91DRAFT_506781 [Kalaharituber pfeilii]